MFNVGDELSYFAETLAAVMMSSRIKIYLWVRNEMSVGWRNIDSNPNPGTLTSQDTPIA